MDRNPRAGFLVVPAWNSNGLTGKNLRQPAPAKETEMMGPDGMTGGSGMGWMGLSGLLVVILIVLGIAALIKYLRD